MKKRAFLSLVLSLAMVLSLAACGSNANTGNNSANNSGSSTDNQTQNDASSTDQSSDTITVGMAMIDYTNAGFIGIKTGADKAAEDYGIELIWKGCDGNLDTQIDQIRGFVQQGVDVIMIDSVDVAGLVSVVNEATDAGVDVLAIGSPIEGTDNYNAVYPDYIDSKFAARMIGNIYEDQEGTIALIAASPGNLVSDNRQSGFEEVMENEFPNLKVATGLGQWDPTTAMTVTEDILRSNDDVLHVHVIQDAMSYGVLRAVQNSGKDIPMSSNDGDTEGLQNFENGYYILENLTGNERIGYWFTALCHFIGTDTQMDKTQYLKTYKIMSDDLKAMAEERGLDEVDGEQMTIVSLEEARQIAQDYQSEFGPDTYTPVYSG